MLIGAIVGATGVGKTELSLSLAKQLGAQIINADSRQIYAGLRIGTAQPTADQLAEVPHHLIDFLNPQESYSAARFLTDVRGILEMHPHQDYILVGGTGLYLQILMEGISEAPPLDLDLRARLETVQKRKGLSFLYYWALQRDPELRQVLRAGDSHRVVRALELMIQTGKPYSEALGPRIGGIGPFPVLFCNRSREELYQRIDARVMQMIRLGWLDEVRALCTQVSTQSPGMLSLGYRQLVSVVQGERTLDQVVPEIQQETRNYAKRQLTWFRNKVPHQELDLGKTLEIHSISAILKDFKKNAQKP